LGQEIKLPEDIVFPMGEDSPAPVAFSHESHVLSQDKPDCTPCHAGTFKILKVDKSKMKPLSMEAMYQGQSCGKCHNGKEAFSAQEECESCHLE
jgi:c(7)-type cytochrome triheme protein